MRFRTSTLFVILLALTVFLFCVDLSVGAVSIPLD